MNVLVNCLVDRGKRGRRGGVSMVMHISFHPDRVNCDLKCIVYKEKPLAVQVIFCKFLDSIQLLRGVVVSEHAFREITPNLSRESHWKNI